METAIETNTNDEIQVLRLKLEMLEKELQFAIDRAERAEREVEQCKLLYRLSSEANNTATNNSTSNNDTQLLGHEPGNVRALAPPPPPPPMPKFNLPPTNASPHGTSLSDGIAAFTLNNMRENNCNTNNQQVKPATGRYRSKCVLYLFFTSSNFYFPPCRIVGYLLFYSRMLCTVLDARPVWQDERATQLELVVMYVCIVMYVYYGKGQHTVVHDILLPIVQYVP